MNEEINVAGVFIPTFVVACIFALGLGMALSATLNRSVSFEIKSFAWHPALFDFAIFVILVDIWYTLLGKFLP
ncbi:hypothetical protein XH99_13310 [Bradyrhizobium nanningense]|uniref:DUF1656 domain-containing protein n=1 Tax=Bradyrhizobium nanningense TaxID=1325118 RepID=A0A4Q0S6B6_9BRAD|nr:DUF1656 domain-containing protein [Bradyrhizobium nanningense]RXH29504.1 hypothetical protein XH99_13310 [Bradyrhizobium nanningense]RXH34627.1 hypothetical protein XH84_06335 [Bradyrhizobium nanningense]